MRNVIQSLTGADGRWLGWHGSKLFADHLIMRFHMRFLTLAIVGALVLTGCTERPGTNSPEIVARGNSVNLSSASMAFPAPGTEIAYSWSDTERGSRPWRGVVTSGPFGEMSMIDHPVHERRSLYPGCLLHCNRTTHPITEASYTELFPLEVGKSAEFVRKRADGSAAWQHRIRVTDTARIKTQLGEFDVFVIETDEQGIEGHIWDGKIVSYWSPELATTVYEVNTSENSDWRAEHILTQYERP